MYSTPRPTRVYGRKLATMKDRHGSHSTIGQRSNQTTDDEEPPRKRRALPGAEQNNVGAGIHGSRNTTPPLGSATDSESDSPKSKGKGKEVIRDLPAGSNAPPETSSAHQSSLSTPKKGPKDLSEIFNAVSPSPTKSQKRPLQGAVLIKPSGLAKRMLSRSRTESLIESSPKSQEERMSRSQSMAGSPTKYTSAKAGPSRVHEEHESQNSQEFSQSSTSEQSGSQVKETKNVKRTYAGHSRSFLLALPASSITGGRNGMKVENLDEDDDSLRDSYQELRRRWGVDNSETDTINALQDDGVISTPEGLYNPLFSITDLRSKGESRRFMDEIGYMFEGLTPTSALSVRRSSAFDIISKLCDQEFWRKTRAAGLIGEIWDQLRAAEAGNGDKVLDSILCCFVSLATEDPRDISSLADKEDFVTTLVRILESHQKKDPFSLSRAFSTSPRKKGTSDSDLMIMKRLNDVIRKMLDMTREDCQPSVRLLLSNVLAAVPHLAFPYIAVVMDSVIGDLCSISKRLAAYRSGLPLLSDSAHDSPCLYHIHNSLSIFDSFLIIGQNDDDTHGLSKSSLMTVYPDLESGLTAVTVAMDILEQQSDSAIMQEHDLSYRVLINLTNDDPQWADAVARDEFTLPTLLRLVTTSYRTVSQMESKKLVQEGDEVYARSMDRLCLALALLTNLAQEVNDLTNSLQACYHASTCLGTRKCIVGCCCANGVDALTILINIYVSLLKQEDGSLQERMEADFNFLRGHLAVLLGLLILQGPPRLVIDKLPGTSAIYRLKSLMQYITELAAPYRSITNNHGADGAESTDADRQPEILLGQSSHTLGNDRMSTNVVMSLVTSLGALQSKLS